MEVLIIIKVKLREKRNHRGDKFFEMVIYKDGMAIFIDLGEWGWGYTNKYNRRNSYNWWEWMG